MRFSQYYAHPAKSSRIGCKLQTFIYEKIDFWGIFHSVNGLTLIHIMDKEQENLYSLIIR